MQKVQFIKHWTDQDFINIQNAIAAYFSNTNLKTHRGEENIRNVDFESIDQILGLAFTSTGPFACYSICNVETYHSGKWIFNHFAIGEDGNFYAGLNDFEENEFIVNIAPLSTKEEVLKNCTVEGHLISLPPKQLSKELYNEVKQALNLIGGNWKGGKVQGFEFKHDPTELLQQIATGEKRNLKKEFQFYGTSDKLADYLVQLADIQEGNTIAEPEAGQGAIVKAILRQHPSAKVEGYELMELNQIFLKDIPGFTLLGDDFLQAPDTKKFDRIIANPPFNKNQDIDHIYKMWDCCEPNGIIVTVASKHWQHSSNKKETAFKQWLDEIKAEVEEVPAGEFKESGTNIATCIIIINKALTPEQQTTGTNPKKQISLF